MKKLLLLLLMLTIGFYVMSCQNEETDGLKVAVSITPQAAFVEKVGGDLVSVTTIIPPGSSPESYDPIARDIVEMNKVEIYFTIGVPAETNNILPEMKNVKIVHLEDYVTNAYDDLYFGEEEHDDEHDEDEHDEDEHHEDEHDDHHDHDHTGRDPHIWLSIKRVIVMVDVIRDELILLDPENEAVYNQNASDFIDELEALDLQIQTLLGAYTMRTFIVYHPSFGYFADDYQLTMLALEDNGKEPSMQYRASLIDLARAEGITRIYHQAEIDSQQVLSFANDISGEAIRLNPLAYDYLASMLDIAEKIAEGLS